MGYVFLLIALLSGATKGFCGKKTSGYVTGFKDAMLANTIRMVLCIAIGLLLIIFSGDASQLTPTPSLIVISAVSGISTALFVVSWLISVKKSAYMMLDVFLMLGMLIPLICSALFLNEGIRLTQWIGVAVLFIAVLIMCSYNNTIKEPITLPSLLLLLLCGFANGITSFSQKLFVKQLPDISVSVFNFYTYIFAAVTLVVAYFILSLKNNEKPDRAKLTKISLYIVVMAVCLFANSFFVTLAANHLDSVILYPLNQGMGLILATAMSAVFFKERLTVKCIVGIVIAFAGLIIINIL